jgi:hypothetical protein
LTANTQELKLDQKYARWFGRDGVIGLCRYTNLNASAVTILKNSSKWVPTPGNAPSVVARPEKSCHNAPLSSRAAVGTPMAIPHLPKKNKKGPVMR